MKTFKVTQYIGLKDFTDSVYPQGAFCLAALLRAKDVKVNGIRVSSDVKLKSGDTVVYYTNAVQESKTSHTVAYEDENIYVADKPSSVSYEGLLSELNGRGEFYGVHRLDRNTEGLIVFAKNKPAESALLKAFKNRALEKTYIALCKNNFPKSKDLLTAYILKDGSGKVKVYHSPHAGALTAVTEYEVMEERGDTALVKIVLHTGRTHQIRAHMAFIGCPVLGDEKYGDRAYNAKYSAKRQRLIAKYLKFNVGGILKDVEGVTFESKFTFLR